MNIKKVKISVIFLKNLLKILRFLMCSNNDLSCGWAYSGMLLVDYSMTLLGAYINDKGACWITCFLIYCCGVCASKDTNLDYKSQTLQKKILSDFVMLLFSFFLRLFRCQNV